MIAEAIKYIAGMADAAKPVHVLTPPAEKSGRYLLARPDGTREWVQPDPAPLAVVLRTPDQVYQFAADHPAGSSELYLSESGLVLVMDANATDDPTAPAGHRKQRVACPFALMDQFAALRSAEALDQTDFVRLLRITLADCLPAELLATVRGVRWSKREETAGQVDHQRQDHSLGRTVELATANAVAVPELVVANVPVLDVLPERPFAIRCALEILHKTSRFRLSPLPGECDRAMDDALGVIAADRPSKGPRLYYGTP